MHLQRTILIAICVSLVFIIHSVTAMNNPELHEGVRKRASNQLSIDQFEEQTLTRHSMSTKEIKGSVAKELRRKREEIKKMQKEEEDKKTILNHGVEWIAKNQDNIFIMMLFLVGLGITICTFSQLISFADASTIFGNNRVPSKYLFGDHIKYPSIPHQDIPISVEELEAVKTARDTEVVASTMQTIIETGQ